MMKTFDAFKDAIQFLEQATSQTYLQCKIEAEEIFSHVMDYEKAKLYSDYIPEITERLRSQIKEILKKRFQHFRCSPSLRRFPLLYLPLESQKHLSQK